MLKENEKYPLEVALEKFIVRLSGDIHKFVYFATHVPKTRKKKMFWIEEMIVWFVGVIIWTFIVMWGFHQIGN